MTNYAPGDVLLLAFPFTDQGRAKQRPALVLLDTGDEDVVVARITGATARDQHDVTLLDWEAAGLILPSSARAHKVATVAKSLVRGRLGRLTVRDRDLVRQALQRAFAWVMADPR